MKLVRNSSIPSASLQSRFATVALARVTPRGHFQTHAVDGLQSTALILRQARACRLPMWIGKKSRTRLRVDVDRGEKALQGWCTHAATFLNRPRAIACRARSMCPRNCSMGG